MNYYIMGSIKSFKEFINENVVMDETIQSYVEQIKSSLTEEALDYLFDEGDQDIISDKELSKVFSKKFMHRDECPHGNGLYLVYDENNSEIELFSTYGQCIVWSVKCDIQNVQSIIDCTVECLNNCVKERDIDAYNKQ